MTYNARELSRWLGAPIHLFIFTRQGLVWRFASCDRDIVIGANTYHAAVISRSAISQTAERVCQAALQHTFIC